MSLADQYHITVHSPCSGGINVDKETDTYWNGVGSGIFSSATLVKLPGDEWMIVCFVSDSSSPCSPTAVFDKDTASASPEGTYTKRGTAGTASVA